MLFIYNQVEKLGVCYKESKGKGSINLVIGGESILIGSSKEAEIKNVMLRKTADKKTITNRLKRIFLPVQGKRLVLDIDQNEFRFIDPENKKDRFNFAQSIIYLVCRGKVEVKTSEQNFVKAPEYTYLHKQDVTVIKLIPRWRAWWEMKEEVILNLVQGEKLVNSFELGWIQDEKGIKTNSLKYRKVEPVKKDKPKQPQTGFKPKKDFKQAPKKPFTNNGGERKPRFKQDDDASRSKYPAKKKKELNNKTR